MEAYGSLGHVELLGELLRGTLKRTSAEATWKLGNYSGVRGSLRDISRENISSCSRNTPNSQFMLLSLKCFEVKSQVTKP